MTTPLPRDAARLVAHVLTVLALVTLSLPGQVTSAAQDAPAEADATLRVVHAAPGAPEVDVLLDGQPILQRLAYGAATDYVTFSPQEHRLQIIPTGQTADAAVVDETVAAVPGQAYILAVFGLLNDIGGAVYEVNLNEIEPGNARVRLINFSPDAGEIDLMETGGDEWFGNVGLGEATDYRDTPPAIYSVDLRGEDDRVLRTIADLELQETRVYDIIALGQVADDSLEIQALVTTVSPPCAEVLGLEGAGSDACLRFVHAAPDAPPVDIYVNDALLAENLAFGTATEFAPVPSGGGRSVRVVPTGAPIEDAVIDTSLDFDPGQAYEILTTGAGEELEVTITGTDLRPLPAGQARLRVIHVSPDAGAIDIGVEGDEANLFEGIDFRGATNYLVIDAGEYPIEVRPGGDDMTVALQTNATFEEGIVYDLIALGRPSDQSLTLLALTASVAIQTGAVATPEAIEDAQMAETVVPETIEEIEVATPAS